MGEAALITNHLMRGDLPVTKQIKNVFLPLGNILSRNQKVCVATAVLLCSVLWWAVYSHLAVFSYEITYDLLHLPAGTALASGVRYFLFTLPRVMLLLAMVMFVMGIVRSFFTPERVRAILQVKRGPLDYIIAALLGVATPFCSCAAVPLFIGFLSVGVPTGMTFTFLIAAPMVNEVAIVLLFGMFGWKVMVTYAGFGMLIAIMAGALLDRWKADRYVESWVFEAPSSSEDLIPLHAGWVVRVNEAAESAREVAGRVWLWAVIGVAAGGLVHLFLPAGLFTPGYAGCADCMKDTVTHSAGMVKLPGMFIGSHWWSVPAAVLMGIPIYSSPVGVIPIVQSLLEKGAPMGTSLAFMMSVVGLSLPELLLLRKVLKTRLLVVFVGIVGLGIICVGYVMNWMF